MNAVYSRDTAWFAVISQRKGSLKDDFFYFFVINLHKIWNKQLSGLWKETP